MDGWICPLSLFHSVGSKLVSCVILYSKLNDPKMDQKVKNSFFGIGSIKVALNKLGPIGTKLLKT